MSANIAKINRFVELRAEGHSYKEITKEISISKPTLIKWSREYKERIEKIAKLLEEQFLSEEKIRRTVRAKRLSAELDNAYTALSKTDYKNLSKRDLITVIEKLERKLESYTKPENLMEPEKYHIVITRRDPVKMMKEINGSEEQEGNGTF